jgi:hypothetical protein
MSKVDKADSVVATLARAVSLIESQERDETRGHEARMKDLARRKSRVLVALDGMTATNGSGRAQGISQERLQKVAEYLRRNPRARQVDIAQHTKLNTGTVSVALRKLEGEGRIVRGEEKDNGSQVWKLKEAKTKPRETVVHVGDGVRKGRRLKVAA